MRLATRYLGLQLAHPIVAAASPLTATLDGMRQLEDAGAAAVVMSSLYEEQIRAEDMAFARLAEHGSNSQAEAGGYFPELPDYDGGVSGHLETLQHASEALDIPVIASLNGTTSEGWIEHARALEQAGAAAIELNVYSVPIDLAVSGTEIERRTLEIVRHVAATVQIPVSIKLAPYFSSMPHMAAELVRAGARGLVLFNRYYAPDIDLATLKVTRSLPLSTAAELPLSLVWIALLSRRIDCSLAASRGVEPPAQDLIEALGLDEVASLALDKMSLGQRRRACLGAALLGPPALLVLDEPDNGLDVKRLAALVELVKVHAASGGATILASHDVAWLDRLEARRIAM